MAETNLEEKTHPEFQEEIQVQYRHPWAKPEPFEDEEITVHIEHPLETCPECSEKMDLFK